MTISEASRQSVRWVKERSVRPYTATLVMMGTLAIALVIVGAWFAGEGTINHVFAQIQAIQNAPPAWVMAPMSVGEVLIPTIFGWTLAMVIMQLSPVPKVWSRFVIIAMLLVLIARYVAWRSLSTLNLSSPLNGTFSILLFVLEMTLLLTSVIQLTLMLKMRSRRQEADRLAQLVVSGEFVPTVDVLIPTYNEPDFILRRTIIACQAMDYPHKSIYLLDDTRRPEIAQLAQDLGCTYMTRPDNHGAKAGNLNHALGYIQGELIVVFDADFVPTQDFLTRTVGFFQNPKVGLVQTPQSFYNADPIARNLGLENILTPEEEVFYRQIQPIRDGVGSVICSGTSFVVRRQALDRLGGFVTESLSEDYFTGIRISALGYQLVYLDEKLSAGLAAENIAAHATQRVRWARGTLQAFFIDSNPLTIRGLNPIQRLAHLEGLLHWFTSISRVGFLLFPLAYSFLGVVPVTADFSELLYYFLPFYVVQLTVFAWLNRCSRSALLSDIYSLVLCFPLALTVLQVMARPFSSGFKVTPKGNASDRFTFNWNLALPLMIMFVLSAISLWRNLGNCFVMGWSGTWVIQHFKGMGLGWVWSAYNLMMLGIAILILLDAPRPSTNEWLNLRRVMHLDLLDSGAEGAPQRSPQRSWWGVTTMLSEEGAEIAVTTPLPSLAEEESIPVRLTIQEEQLTLQGRITCTSSKDGFPVARIWFDALTLEQQRHLVKLLFCRPGQWLSNDTPGEFQSLLLLFRMLFRPKIVFERRVNIQAVAIAQV